MDMILLSDILLFAIAFLYLAFASVTDIKKREVPNWLCFSLIAIAFAIRLLVSILTSQSFYLLYAIISFILFFILANILYYAKFFGGGDAKLITALAVIFATTPSFLPASISLEIFQEPFLLSFIINTFFLGSVYSIFFIVFFEIKNFKNLKQEFKKVWKKSKIIRILFISLAIFSLVLVYFSTLFILVSLLIFFFPFLYIIVKATENSCMIKNVSPRDLTEGDWLVNKIKINKKIIKPSVHGLSSQDIATLRKYNKKVLIKYGIPFVPVFLLSLITTALFGDLIVLIIRALFF